MKIKNITLISFACVILLCTPTLVANEFGSQSILVNHYTLTITDAKHHLADVLVEFNGINTKNGIKKTWFLLVMQSTQRHLI